MLRVDLRDPASGAFRPAGAFSIFAMHGTGNAPANDLLDADIHGLVERRLERHIDRDLNHVSDSGFVPRAVYLFANGAEGDVSPAWPPQSRCDVPALAPLPAVGMATLVGADDAHTRMQGWRLFGVFDIGLEEGSPSPDVPGCQAQKRKLLDGWFGNLPNRLFVSGTLPSFAQITVLRLGNRLI